MNMTHPHILEAEAVGMPDAPKQRPKRCPRCDSIRKHELYCRHCHAEGCEHCIWISDLTLDAFCAEELTLFDHTTRLLPSECLEQHYLDLLLATSTKER